MLLLGEDIPVEILEAISDRLPSRKDRRSLWQVSKVFYDALAPRVFETVTIRAKDNNILRLDSRPYSSLSLSHPLECLKLIKHLHLRAPFRKNFELPTRCPGHHAAFTDLNVALDIIAGLLILPPHGRLDKVKPLLAQLQENGLLSFSWDLGMCMPPHIFGSEGYLTKKQTAIRSLSLITPSREMWGQGEEVDEPMILSVYSKLQTFSWKGLCSRMDMDCLRSLFAANSQTLEDLELDFIDWAHVSIDADLDEPPTAELESFDAVLPRRSNGKPLCFKNLKRLALSNFEFEDPTLRISHTFNVKLLRSLKLNSCEGILVFLSTIVSRGVVMTLRSLELVLIDDVSEQDGNVQSTLISFLNSFQGLEDLYLMNGAPPGLQNYRERWRPHYWNAINHHSSTLKRLVYHERRLVWTTWGGTETHLAVDGAMYNGQYWSRPREDDFYDRLVYNTTLPRLDLECFGVSDEVADVEYTMLNPLSKKHGFKLFHIRKTGASENVARCRTSVYRREIHFLNAQDLTVLSRLELFDLTVEAHLGEIWSLALKIFQSPQFEELQILAFGDFSHGGRYEDFQLLLCRAVTAIPEIQFKVMSRDDIAYHKRSGLLDMNFLAACPRSRLLGTTPLWEP